ncbi:hypothetical protein CASFOL_023691 [Castilleja foliolosa]|uniref:Uncharacterized protein n=1 Tax=Castilleja foliolosa TaxID=1961234 RepID=A0ABD3CQ50_9LAMI
MHFHSLESWGWQSPFVDCKGRQYVYRDAGENRVDQDDFACKGKVEGSGSEQLFKVAGSQHGRSWSLGINGLYDLCELCVKDVTWAACDWGLPHSLNQRKEVFVIGPHFLENKSALEFLWSLNLQYHWTMIRAVPGEVCDFEIGF